jgi:hypothetical protein
VQLAGQHWYPHSFVEQLQNSSESHSYHHGDSEPNFLKSSDSDLILVLLAVLVLMLVEVAAVAFVQENQHGLETLTEMVKTVDS